MILHIKCAENILINKSHIESLSQIPGSQLIIFWYHFKSVAGKITDQAFQIGGDKQMYHDTHMLKNCCAGKLYWMDGMSLVKHRPGLMVRIHLHNTQLYVFVYNSAVINGCRTWYERNQLIDYIIKRSS